MSHIPERTCIACRTKAPKKNFFKIVRTKNQEILFDEFHKINGRSIYLCKKEKCLNRIFQTNKGDQIYSHLKVKLSGEQKEKLFLSLVQCL